MKKYNLIYLFILSVFLFGCEQKDADLRIVQYPAPTVSGYEPSSGFPGEYVTITGANLDTLPPAVKVWFGGIEADSIIESTGTQIKVKVPDDAISGAISLQVWTHKIDSIGNFTVYPAPVYSTISSTRVQVGDIVTITGQNFGTDVSNAKVIIGNTEAEIVSFSDTKIEFKTPDVPSNTLYLVFGELRITGPAFFIGDVLLQGTLIGHSGSWSNNPATMITAAVDGDLNTYVDAASASGYVGYDFGAGNAAHLNLVRYAPRSGYPERMIDGEIRGSNDPTLSDYTVLYKIMQAPQEDTYTSADVVTSESYRYIYYYAATGNCNIAEIEFYGQLEEVPIEPAAPGELIYDFDKDGDNEGWEPQGAAWTVEGGALNVTFPQTTGNKRADLAQTIHGSNGNVLIHTGNFPIVAMKVNLPASAHLTFDTDLGSIGNGSNKYKEDFVDQDVYYWDLSTQTFGTTLHPNEGLSLSTFQFKIADIPETDPATGYSVQWIRTFASVEELESFIK